MYKDANFVDYLIKRKGMGKAQNNSSVLRKLYNEQKATENVQPQKIFEQKGDIFCLSKWILIGALVQCVVLAPLIILYTRGGR